ncbi:LysR substrate-binding domain-containing protein [Pseudovibrio sp. Ad37]|uniref:LysR substrate-binding domain-containing protein n=1 Tax=Pseudovibrio sp. Ad37 TaxID=989422 RepID=UPI0023AA5A6C|nr:LysR substrate-binding domain-containing protein [Pseudovibrio sp. Ad37]
MTGPVFDSSLAMADIAKAGLGIALLPYDMFKRRISEGRLVRPFPFEVTIGKYWLTHLKSKPALPATILFKNWLLTLGAVPQNTFS